MKIVCCCSENPWTWVPAEIKDSNVFDGYWCRGTEEGPNEFFFEPFNDAKCNVCGCRLGVGSIRFPAK